MGRRGCENITKEVKLEETHYLKDIGAKHIGKEIMFKATIKKQSQLSAIITKQIWSCKECNNEMIFHRIEGKINPPSICPNCGKKSFRLDHTDYTDFKRIEIEEPLDYQINGSSYDFEGIIEGHYASPQFTMTVGDVAIIKAIVTLKEQKGKEEQKFILNIQEIELIDNKYNEKLDITEKDLEKIKKLSKRKDLFELLCDNICNGIVVKKEVVEGILLQIFGGDGRDRNVVHVLVIGDPGVGKTKQVKEISTNIQKKIWVGGAGATKAGLTASAVRDEILGGWGIEAGAVVLSNNGFLIIDEFDKLKPKSQLALNEAMESLEVNVSKAGLIQNMKANTSIIAIANPKNGKFDKYNNSFKQDLNIDPTLLSRFDLIYAIVDIVDPDKDHREALAILRKEDNRIETIDKDLLKKYIAHAKENIFPELDEGAVEDVAKYYLNIRVNNKDNDDSKPLTKRELMALERLSIARAKLELSNKVTKEHVKEAIRIYTQSLESINLSPATVGEVVGVASNKELAIRREIEDWKKDNGSLIGFEKIPFELLEEIKSNIVADEMTINRIYDEMKGDEE